MRKPRDFKLRVGAFELTKRGVDRWDWRDPYHLLVELNWWQFVAAFVAVELAVNLLFAALYMLVPGCIANLPPGSLLLAFSFSLETLATVGYGVMAPATTYGHVVSAIEIVSGVLFTALVTGLIFVRFARPRAKVLTASHAVVGQHEGHPTLMVRIGNGRLGSLVDATARMSALVIRGTREGRELRSSVDLALERGSTPNFALTWTLFHRIDDDSPLFGVGPRDFAQRVVRLYVIFEARDPVLAASIHVVKDWGPEQVLFGMRYADAVTVDDQGRIVADLGLISDMVPDLALAASGHTRHSEGRVGEHPARPPVDAQPATGTAGSAA